MIHSFSGGFHNTWTNLPRNQHCFWYRFWMKRKRGGPTLWNFKLMLNLTPGDHQLSWEKWSQKQPVIRVALWKPSPMARFMWLSKRHLWLSQPVHLFFGFHKRKTIDRKQICLKQVPKMQQLLIEHCMTVK